MGVPEVPVGAQSVDLKVIISFLLYYYSAHSFSRMFVRSFVHLQGKLKGCSAEEVGQCIKRLLESSPGVKKLILVRLVRL